MTKEEKEKAIDALKISAPVMAMTHEEFNDYIQTLNKVMDWLEQEPKTGHWIDDNENELDAQYGRHLYKCSECGKYADAFVGGTEDWWDIEKPNYCPNCGAKMESEDVDGFDN